MEIGKAVDDDAQQKQDGRAPQRVPPQPGARFAAVEPSLSGEDDGRAHHEKKSGKYQIRSRESVPIGVAHLSPCAVAAGIVHHDHEGDGEAAQNIERKQTPGRRIKCGTGHSARAPSIGNAPTLRDRSHLRQAGGRRLAGRMCRPALMQRRCCRRTRPGFWRWHANAPSGPPNVGREELSIIARKKSPNAPRWPNIEGMPCPRGGVALWIKTMNVTATD